VTGLLDGYARAVERLNSPPKLVMVGDHDDQFVDLETAVASRGLTESVVRPGYVKDDELVRLYANALAFVFPSCYEGFGLPVLEAMASDTPVIAADASALPEVCGDAARYVNPDDIWSIATSIVDVVSSADLRERLHRAGRKRVGTFTWERTGRETATLYESLLEP
jgi:glycosyltransferase involved in cell wall biosynthesis